jgi:hypothetical protein
VTDSKLTFTVMPPLSTATENRFANIIICLTAAADTVEVMSHTFKTPFLEAITATTQSLLGYVQVNFLNGFPVTNSHIIILDDQTKQE